MLFVIYVQNAVTAHVISISVRWMKIDLYSVILLGWVTLLKTYKKLSGSDIILWLVGSKSAFDVDGMYFM